MLTVNICLLGALLLTACNGLTFPPPKTCQIAPTDPKPDWDSIPKAVIDLDSAPVNRWQALGKEKKTEVVAMVDEFVEHLKTFPGSKWEEFLIYLEANQDMLLDRMPNGYGDEIRGIQEVTDLQMSSLLAFNLGYELMGACTSITAEDDSGKMIHGRNLDFGLFLGHDNSTGSFQWTNTDLLRQITVLTDFTRGGEVLYSTVSYVGYVGLLTGVRRGGVSVSVDTRFDDNYDAFLKVWVKDPSDSASLLSQALRSQIEDDAVGTDYETYWKQLGSTRLVGPAYAIIGGPKAGQGIVITIQPNATVPIDEWSIHDADGMPSTAAVDDKFYVLETNYDHWEAAPMIDDRRTAAVDCMDNYVGKNDVSKESIYSVLSALPSRNRLTTYTAIMDCAEGTIQASLQYCYEDACAPW